MTWNSSATIKECIGSILCFDRFARIIVVDNCSSDNTCDILDEFRDSIQVIELNENTGFARGNNIGLSQIRTPYVFCLNPDAFLIENISTRLINALDQDCTVGIACPELVFPDGSFQRSAYPFHSYSYQFFDALGLRWLFDSISKGNNYCEKPFWAIGAAMLMRTDELQKLGGFAEDYFMYSEDMDLCKRYMLRNLRTCIFDECKVVHIGGVSESSNSEYIRAEKLFENELDYLAKFSSGNLLLKYRVLLSAYFFRKQILRFCYHGKRRSELLARADINSKVLSNRLSLNLTDKD